MLLKLGKFCFFVDLPVLRPTSQKSLISSSSNYGQKLGCRGWSSILESILTTIDARFLLHQNPSNHLSSPAEGIIFLRFFNPYFCFIDIIHKEQIYLN